MNVHALRFSCLALLISCLIPMISEARLFNTRIDHEVAINPHTVNSVDLDNDGHLDLLITNVAFTDKNITILRGRGDGSFAPAEYVDCENGEHSTAIGDIDGNGSPDLVITNYRWDNVSILLGNGDGSFQPPQTIDYGERPNAVALGDLNGDGMLDLVTAFAGSETEKIKVFQGHGDGTFTLSQVEIFDDEDSFQAVAIGDLDGDGVPDLVAAESRWDRIYIYKGLGDCTFELWGALTYCGDSDSIALGDLDGDQQLDLVAIRSYTTIAVFLGNGHLTFLAPVEYTTGSSVACVSINDLDSDGNPDLVVASRATDTVAVLRGTGGGSFDPATSYTVGNDPASAAIGDLNEDGFPDLAAANYRNNVVSVLQGTGAGTFYTAPIYATGDQPNEIAHGDINGDGTSDLATANRNTDDISLYFGNGDGTFQEMTSCPTDYSPYFVALNDLDDDGDDDLAVGYLSTNYVSVMLSNGDGTFGATSDYAVGESPCSLAIGDLNNDDVPDLAVANNDSHNISILLGAGHGTFSPAITYDFWASGRPCSIAMDDLDGDGLQDLVVVRSASYNLDIGLGNGDGTFRGGGSFDVHHPNPIQVTTGDLNANGIPEIVVAYSNYNITSVSVYWDYQDRVFAYDSQVHTRSSCRSAAISDLNDDGIQDLVMANADNNDVAVRLGSGGTAFSAPEYYGVGNYPRSIACVDLDGDGFNDVATADMTSDTISVLINTSDIMAGTVSAALTCTPGSGTLPFQSQFQAAMTNTFASQARRFQYRIDVTLAGGLYYANWRRGWQNIMAGESYNLQWWQNIPNSPSLSGMNHFELTVADVTPPPYNQPPYPPEGDTDHSGCTIEGVMP